MAGIGRLMSVFRFQITDFTHKFKVLRHRSDEPILTELLKLLLKISVDTALAFARPCGLHCFCFQPSRSSLTQLCAIALLFRAEGLQLRFVNF